jgi:glycosyltransferase involved in cell wall biosynthesis
MEGNLLQNTNIAIVSSKEGSRLFDFRYPWFHGEKIEVPLIYENLEKELNPIERRKYITFVGPPVPAKGPDIFLRIVENATKYKLDYPFLLISRLQVNDPSFRNKDNLTIFHQKRISDEEFGVLIRNSLVVLTPYKRETQSSVILVSYMYGTPVVSSNVGGLPEFVIHKKTGYLVDNNSSVEEWINGINYVIGNFQEISANCKRYFIENYSGKNWKKYINMILI